MCVYIYIHIYIYIYTYCYYCYYYYYYYNTCIQYTNTEPHGAGASAEEVGAGSAELRTARSRARRLPAYTWCLLCPRSVLISQSAQSQREGLRSRQRGWSRPQHALARESGPIFPDPLREDRAHGKRWDAT